MGLEIMGPRCQFGGNELLSEERELLLHPLPEVRLANPRLRRGTPPLDRSLLDHLPANGPTTARPHLAPGVIDLFRDRVRPVAEDSLQDARHPFRRVLRAMTPSQGAAPLAHRSTGKLAERSFALVRIDVRPPGGKCLAWVATDAFGTPVTPSTGNAAVAPSVMRWKPARPEGMIGRKDDPVESRVALWAGQRIVAAVDPKVETSFVKLFNPTLLEDRPVQGRFPPVARGKISGIPLMPPPASRPPGGASTTR